MGILGMNYHDLVDQGWKLRLIEAHKVTCFFEDVLVDWVSSFFSFQLLARDTLCVFAAPIQGESTRCLPTTVLSCELEETNESVIWQLTKVFVLAKGRKEPYIKIFHLAFFKNFWFLWLQFNLKVHNTYPQQYWAEIWR